MIESRNFGLDCIRFFAIVWVVVLHGKYLVNDSFSSIYAATDLGIDGVSIFFVLSGFLIGKSILKSGPDYNFAWVKNFWISRWLRTLPAYFAVLVCLLLFGIFSKNYFSTIFIIKHFVFVQNFIIPNSNWFRESWSLATEEWFYLGFPVLLLSLQFVNKKSYLSSAFIMFFTSVFLRIIYPSILPAIDFNDYRFVMALRLDGIALGLILAYYNNKFPKWFISNKLHLVKLALILLILVNVQKYFPIINYKLFVIIILPILESVITFCLIPYALYIKFKQNKLTQFITQISILSYSIYLVNFQLVQRIILPIFIKFMGLPGRGLIVWIMFIALTYIVAYALHHSVEKPFLSLRKRILS